MDIETILSLVKFAIDEEPKVAESIRNLFGKGDPTQADWDAEIARVNALDFDTLVPNAKDQSSGSGSGTPPAAPATPA